MADQGSIANLKQNINENIYDNTDYDISGGRLNTVLQNVVDTLNFNGRDFFNVNEYREKSDEYTDAAAGRAAVPDEVKKIGLVITYLLADGWYIDQFVGSDISGWETASNWKAIGPVSVFQNTLMIGGEDKGELFGTVVDSFEWIWAVVDFTEHILFGIKKDGNLYFANDCPPQIVNYISEHYVAKENDKSLIDSDIADALSIQSSLEYLYAFVDNDNKVLGGFKKNGRFYADIAGITEMQNEVAYLKTNFYPSLANKKIVCFGDSITMFKYGTPERNYPMWMSELSNATVIGCGFGGTRITSRTTPTLNPTNSNEAFAPFDIVNLIKYICNNDYSYLDAGLAYIVENEGSWLGNQYTETLNRLKSIDWSEIDYVTFLGGTNDFSAGVSIGSITDTGDNTIYGALYQIVSTLLTNKKNLKLYMFTPLVRMINYNEPNEKFSDETTLPDYVEAIIDGAKNLKLPVCDLYYTMGWNQYNFSNYFIDTDGTHPYKGFKDIATKILRFINSN